MPKISFAKTRVEPLAKNVGSFPKNSGTEEENISPQEISQNGVKVDKDAIIAKLMSETSSLKAQVSSLADIVTHIQEVEPASRRDDSVTFFSSPSAGLTRADMRSIPDEGMPAKHVKELIDSMHLCDFQPRLNTSSYVNVVFEPEEEEVALIGAKINIADASVYPASVCLHDQTVNMIAKLWHAPEPADGGNYAGAGTVGSTEACLLGGLAAKFRWRKWYAKKHNLTEDEVLGIRPNIVISSAFQAAWEKLFRYFDVMPKIVKPSLVKDKLAVDPSKLVAECDDKTIAVVAILGNHYNGVYDPVWDIDALLTKVNKEKGYQIGIHVDAASGGFIAPFQSMGPNGPPPFDFRLDSVLSISASGHKFGESICGTGWLVFRQREDLSEHIAVAVTYLGGTCESMTLNFSRPASGPYVQFYKLLRLGKEGYRVKVEHQMEVTSYLRSFLANLKHPSGKPYFEILDGGDSCCLPVVAARLNTELDLKYDDIDLQHAVAEMHWYVSGYCMGFENFGHGNKFEALCTDIDEDSTMFRIVVKSNLTHMLAENLAESISAALDVLDKMESGYASVHATNFAMAETIVDDLLEKGGSKRMDASISGGTMLAIHAAAKWKRKMEQKEEQNQKAIEAADAAFKGKGTGKVLTSSDKKTNLSQLRRSRYPSAHRLAAC